MQSTLDYLQTIEAYLPVALDKGWTLLLGFLVLLGFIVFRYFLMVGPFWLFYYWWVPRQKPQQILNRKIYQEFPSGKQQLFEIKWSLLSAFIFAGAGLLMGVLWQNDWSLIYLSFDQYGLWYLPLSWLLMTLIQDTYFYWTHRWLHIPTVFKRYHRIHHESLNPSPWASFSFHPVEALINALFLPLIILVLPLHPLVIMSHLVLMTVTAILNHLGYETLPRWAYQSGFAKYWISGLHHGQHHKQFNTNYALFFSFWDHWMGTENAKFEGELNRIFAKKAISESSERKPQSFQPT